MSLLEETKCLLRKYRIKPKKALGQNFMVEPHVLQLMVDYASLKLDDTVLEVGAGLGFLTDLLRKASKTVLAVEVDSGLAGILREQLKDASNVKITEGNVLETTVPSFNKVVSIPPYHISSRLLVWLFGRVFDRAVLIFQKEFANRLVASVGSEDYGWLTVLTHYHSEVETLDYVPKWTFYPQPEIGSVIVRLEPKNPRPYSSRNEKLFRQLVQSCFAKRNRKVKNAILAYVKGFREMSGEKAIGIIEALPFREKRVRELAPEDFGVIADALID
jgi:16S rRNA (adenine1518-N6/adenine1519-N6)-dimethyltransferase